jgi:F-type H+-transporting ATPase subunit b
MQIDWWTLALQTIHLLVLVWLLGRFLFKPIARIVEERQAAVAQALDDAKAMREQAEQAEAEAKSATAKIAAERNTILEKANDEAAKEKARLIDGAREETSQMIEQAKRDIGRMRETEAAENGKRASELAVDIAARLFERLPDEARIAGFIDGLGDALKALPDQVRSEIGMNEKPITVRAARQLSNAETQACRKAIANALGRDAAITVTVEPDLIAGLEIETPHAVARNSLRADLDRIAEELTSDGERNG